MKKLIKSLFSRERFLRVTLPILLVIVLVVIALFSYQKPVKNLSQEEAKAKAEQFINTYLLSGGNKATIKEITEEYGLYKLKIDIVSSVVDSYLSRDGKLFFPQALDVEKMSNEKPNQAASGEQAAPVAEVTKKSDKPNVELFVMSHCPYGTQMEKGLLPAVAALGNKIDFQIKFNSYAMHGEKELKEQLNQYCIQKEQLPKFSGYLKCFLESSDSAACVSSTGVDKAKMEACASKTDKQYKVIDNFNNKVGYQGSFPGFDIYKADNEKYNVGGSPTLIVNGEQVSSGRDSASLLKAICSAFNNQPKECQAALSSASPAPGFGSGTQEAGAAAAACQ